MRQQPGSLVTHSTALIGAFLAILHCGFWIPDVRAGCLSYIALFALLFVVYLAAVFRAAKNPSVPLWVVLALAVAMRLVHFGYEPFLSDDLYRYHWDGAVQNAGINPFRYTPGAPELRTLRDDHWEGINHKQMPTVYPPAAQAVFLAAHSLWADPIALRVAFVLFEIALMLVLARLLRLRGRPPSALIVYAWNPLAVQEFAGHGHLDAMAICFLFAGVLYLATERPLRANAALALSFLTKFFAVAALPVFLRRSGVLKGIALVAGLAALAYLPYLSVGQAVAGNLRTYARHWEFNASIYYLLKWLVGSEAARVACATLFAAIVGLATWKTKDDLTATGAIVIAWLCLFPTVHPWYVLWALPFACFFALRSVVWLTFAVALTYAARFSLVNGSGWVESMPALVLEWVVFYGLLARDMAHARKRRVR